MDCLDDSFAVCHCSHDSPHAIVLDSACKYFRGAGAPFVYKYRQRDLQRILPVAGFLLTVAVFILRIHNDPLRENVAQDVAHRREKAAGIIPEIDHQPLHSLLFQRGKSLFVLFRRDAGKLGYPYIPGILVQHFLKHGGKLHILYVYRYFKRLLHSLPVNGKIYFPAFRFFDHFHHFRRFFFRNVYSVYCADHIFRLKPGQIARSLFITLRNPYAAFRILLYGNANPHIGAFGSGIRLFILLGGIITGIRISQTVKKACIYPLRKTVSIYFSEIFLIDQRFQVIQFPRVVRIGKNAPVLHGISRINTGSHRRGGQDACNDSLDICTVFHDNLLSVSLLSPYFSG